MLDAKKRPNLLNTIKKREKRPRFRDPSCARKKLFEKTIERIVWNNPSPLSSNEQEIS